jgi:hypothetical protein
MAIQKRGSRTLDKAEVRLASIKSISPTLDVGEGLTVQDYTEKIQSLSQSLEAYNSDDVALANIIRSHQYLA